MNPGGLALLAVVCLSVAFVSTAQPVTGSVQDFSKLDRQIETYRSQLGARGIAVAIVRNGEIQYAKGFGVAGPGGDPVTAQTAFQTGSVSKSFAALVVLQLASEGKLGLDDPVVQFMPSFRTADKALSDQITVEHLVTHRSGMTTLNGNRYQFTTDRSSTATADAVAEIADDRLFAEPGTTFQYSNANYATLAHLIERVDGQSYEQAVAKRVFEPLQMRNSFIQMPPREGIPLASGYRTWFGVVLPTDFIAGRRMMAAGGVTASITDLARYVEAVRTRDPRIVPAQTADRLFAAHPIAEGFGYAYGWFVQDGPEFQRVFHDGLNPGFAAMAAIIPERNEVIVVLTNLSGMMQGNLTGAILNDALSLEPLEASPGWLAHLGLWSVAGTALGLLIWLCFTIKRLIQRKPTGQPKRPWLNLTLGLAFPVVSYLLLVAVPHSAGATLRSAYMFYPDLVIAVFIAGVSSALLGGGQLLLWIRARTKRSA